MTGKFLHIFVCVCLAFVAGASCRPANTAESAPAREITDDLGRRVKLPARIERVVSLAPSVTENVFAAGGGGKLVGVTTYCDFPAEAQTVNKIGDTLKPNLETIVALKPNLVIASTDSQLEAFIRQMEQQNIPVFVTKAENVDDVLRNLRQIGDLLDTRPAADRLIASLISRLEAVDERVRSRERVKTFLQISREPLFTVGKESFVTDSIRRAGGESVTANVPEAYPKISKETVLASQPDAVILTVSGAMGAGNDAPAEVLQNSPAVRSKRIYKINGDLLTRPSPRLVDGVEAMANALHP